MYGKIRAASCLLLFGAMIVHASMALGESAADAQTDVHDRIVETCLSDEDVKLIALVTMAEAEGESELGKRLVIDTILNRKDSPDFPDAVREVIYQPAQFSSMWNGRVDRCYVLDDICQLVWEELEGRTDYDVMFFTAGEYGKFGEPMFREGNHYFCR